MESMFRFNIEPTPAMINIGYGIVILAVTMQLTFTTAWIYIEWSARHPLGVHEEEEAPSPTPPTPPPPPPTADDDDRIKILETVTQSLAELSTSFQTSQASFANSLMEQIEARLTKQETRIQAIQEEKEIPQIETSGKVQALIAEKGDQGTRKRIILECLNIDPLMSISKIQEYATVQGVSLSTGYISKVRKESIELKRATG
jgi:hypothetical protein